MVIDLLERNRVNIKDLTLKNPKRREAVELIDVDQLLTAKDKQRLVDYYEDEFGLYRKGRYAVYIAILCPEELKGLDSLDSKWVDSVWSVFLRDWKDLKLSGTNWYQFARYTRELMILFPEKTSRMIQDNPLEEDAIKTMRDQIQMNKKGKLWNIIDENNAVEIGTTLKMLAPNQLPEPLFTTEEWDDMINSFETQLREENDTFYFFTQAINMKILSVNTNLAVNLSPQALQFAQQYLLDKKSFTGTNPENWEAVAAVAAGLKVLAAGNVELTNQGLKLTPADRKQEFNQELVPVLPITRKF